MSKEFPPKGELITYNCDIRDMTSTAIGGHIRFDDPEYIGFEQQLGEEGPHVAWSAAGSDPVGMLYRLRELLVQGEFKNGGGRVVLRNSESGKAYELFTSPRTIVSVSLGGEGSVNLWGNAECIAAEIMRQPENVIAYMFDNNDIEVSYFSSFPVDYHDIPTYEILLHELRKEKLTRFVVDQCAALTGSDCVKNTIDASLDEFAQFIPSLSR